MRTPTALWKRLTRRLGRDDNPLRRRSDVIDAWLLPVAIVIFACLCPLVIGIAGGWMHSANVSDHRVQASWHSVRATLRESVPGPQEADHGTNSWLTWAPATWTQDQVRHQADVPVQAGSRAGIVVTVWLDKAGNVHVPPLTSGQMASRVLEARAGGVAALAVLLAVLVLMMRRILDRRRLADWEHAWLSVGPTWSRRR